MEKNNLCLIIPAYNEERRIGPTLEEYVKYFRSRKKDKKLGNFQILVVLNACKDNTLEIVKSYQREFKEIKLLNLTKVGKGLAIIGGFKSSIQDKNVFNLIGFVDADMATSPEAFFDLVQNIGDYGGIIASRYISGARVDPKQTFARILVSRIFNFLIRSLFFMPYRDTQCGAKLFKRKVVEEITDKINLTQWAFDVDLLYQVGKAGFKVKEFPTVWSDKKYSTINFMKAGPRMALSIVRLRIVNSRFKFLIDGYDLLPNFIKIHHSLK